MRSVRRHDYSPRVEMMPLIDVVFLLLTFFIVAMVVMVEVRSSGASLLTIEGGAESVDEPVVLMEVDGAGGVLIDGEPVADDELDARLRAIASRPDEPMLVLALQDVDASVDRGPIVLRLQQRVNRAGVGNLRLLENLGGGPGVRPE